LNNASGPMTGIGTGAGCTNTGEGGACIAARGIGAGFADSATCTAGIRAGAIIATRCGEGATGLDACWGAAAPCCGSGAPGLDAGVVFARCDGEVLPVPVVVRALRADEPPEDPPAKPMPVSA
jgi:hypothetical protein